MKTVAEAIHASLAVKVSAAVIDATSDSDDLDAVSAWLTRDLKEGTGLVFIISPKTRPASLPIDPEHDQLVLKPCSAEAVREAVDRALSGAGQPRRRSRYWQHRAITPRSDRAEPGRVLMRIRITAPP